MSKKQRDAETKAAIEADMWPDAFEPVPVQETTNSGPAVVRGSALLAALTKKK